MIPVATMNLQAHWHARFVQPLCASLFCQSPYLSDFLAGQPSGDSLLWLFLIIFLLLLYYHRLYSHTCINYYSIIFDWFYYSALLCKKTSALNLARELDHRIKVDTWQQYYLLSIIKVTTTTIATPQCQYKSQIDGYYSCNCFVFILLTTPLTCCAPVAGLSQPVFNCQPARLARITTECL